MSCRVDEWYDSEMHLILNILNSIFGYGPAFKLFSEDYSSRNGTCHYFNMEDPADAYILTLMDAD